MKCDELKDYDYDPDFPFQSRGRFYVAEEVDAAIAELKAAHHKERHEYIKMVAELKQKLEDAKATAYTESVDAGMRERRMKRFLFFIIDEHKAACSKHPKFCDEVIDPTATKSWAEAEYRVKLRNERGPWTADNILAEEMAEAFAAYEQGDKEHALQELAQCGAVILRIMETIEKEMKKK